jgi:hypothetical protein
MTETSNVTFLLVSNSKFLKSKFIESLSSDLNRFSLMSKSSKLSAGASEPVTISCYVSDYTTETLESNIESLYVQLVDANDKALTTSLIRRSSELEPAENQLHIQGIVYLYDELNSDTFAYVNSIHAELNKSCSKFIKSDTFTCLLFNIVDGTNINGQSMHLRKSQAEDAFKLTMLLDSFLDEFTNVQYVCLEGVNEIREMMEGGEDQAGNQFKLRSAFELLLYRYAPSQSQRKVRDYNENTGNGSNANSNLDQVRSSKKNTYKGEMARNLRNGNYVANLKFFFLSHLFL